LNIFTVPIIAFMIYAYSHIFTCLTNYLSDKNLAVAKQIDDTIQAKSHSFAEL